MQIKAKKLDLNHITVSLEMIHPEIRRIKLIDLMINEFFLFKIEAEMVLRDK